MLVEFLTEGEDVEAADALVVHTVHQLTNEIDTEAADGTVFCRERRIGLSHTRGVEMLAAVGDDELQPGVVRLTSTLTLPVVPSG